MTGRALATTDVGVEKLARRFGIQHADFYSVQIQEKQKEKEMQIRRVLKQFPLVLMGALVFVTGTLSAQDVRYNFMPGTDFSKFHTYKWISIQGGAHPNQIVDAQIKQSVDSQLVLKGLTKILPDDKANLYIGYQIAVNKEKQWNAFGMGGIRWGGGMATATSSPISVGTLVLDMYDPETKQLVWTGTATKTLDPSSNPQKNQQRLEKAMAKLLKNYPPKQK
jgi:Domain of unknown function (DUF4136)